MRRILVLALLLRLLTIPFTRSGDIVPDWKGVPLDSDGVGYASYAESLWKGKGYVEATGDRSHRSPGYPFLIWLSFKLGGYQFLIVRVFQAVLGTAACWLLYVLGRSGWGDRAGLWAAGGAAVYPPFLFYTPQVLNSILYLTLVVSTLAVLAWAAEGGMRRALVPGFLLGAAALTAGTVLGAAPWLALWLAWRRRSLFPALFMALGCLAVLAPWMLRNHKIHGHFILLDTNSGGVLFLGNVNHAYWVDSSSPDALDAVKRDTRYLSLDEAGKDRLLRALAVDWMRAHPGEFLKVWAAKFFHAWNPVPSGKPLKLVAASCLTYGVALALGLWGAWGSLRAGHPLGILLVAYLLAVSATHAVFVMAQRHRVPLLDPALIILGASVLAGMTAPEEVDFVS